MNDATLTFPAGLTKEEQAVWLRSIDDRESRLIVGVEVRVLLKTISDERANHEDLTESSVKCEGCGVVVPVEWATPDGDAACYSCPRCAAGAAFHAGVEKHKALVEEASELLARHGGYLAVNDSVMLAHLKDALNQAKAVAP